eukprot:TRINITY_DN773166_c0_g1_i1.p1 TRINITY_DN773166_c0_g1~~TRINITY_DN773166_c0_g1_i1.p1  ORF type:complete len:653 (-),score=149.22 TRINITY_DN773166_c0_g1_i1:134-2092(-)
MDDFVERGEPIFQALLQFSDDWVKNSKDALSDLLTRISEFDKYTGENICCDCKAKFHEHSSEIQNVFFQSFRQSHSINRAQLDNLTQSVEDEFSKALIKNHIDKRDSVDFLKRKNESNLERVRNAAIVESETAIKLNRCLVDEDFRVLKQDMDALHARALEKQEAQISSQRKEIETLEYQLAVVHNQIAALKTRNDNFDVEREKMQNAVQRQKRISERWKTRCHNYTQNIGQLESRISELMKEAAQLRRHKLVKREEQHVLIAQQEQTIKHQNSLKIVETKMRETQNKCSSMEEELTELRGVKADWEVAEKKMGKSLEAAESEISRLKELVRKHEVRLVEVEDTGVDREKQLTLLHVKIRQAYRTVIKGKMAMLDIFRSLLNKISVLVFLRKVDMPSADDEMNVNDISQPEFDDSDILNREHVLNCIQKLESELHFTENERQDVDSLVDQHIAHGLEEYEKEMKERLLVGLQIEFDKKLEDSLRNMDLEEANRVKIQLTTNRAQLKSAEKTMESLRKELSEESTKTEMIKVQLKERELLLAEFTMQLKQYRERMAAAGIMFTPSGGTLTNTRNRERVRGDVSTMLKKRSNSTVRASARRDKRSPPRRSSVIVSSSMRNLHSSSATVLPPMKNTPTAPRRRSIVHLPTPKTLF